MSQYFDYFVGTRELIEAWGEANARFDEEEQAAIEEKMARTLSLKNVGQDDFALLSECSLPGKDESFGAVADFNLVLAVSEEEGPWIMSFPDATIAAIAGLAIDDAIIQRWIDLVIEFNGLERDYVAEFLTHETAQEIQQFCTFAMQQKLSVYVAVFV